MKKWAKTLRGIVSHIVALFIGVYLWDKLLYWDIARTDVEYWLTTLILGGTEVLYIGYIFIFAIIPRVLYGDSSIDYYVSISASVLATLIMVAPSLIVLWGIEGHGFLRWIVEIFTKAVFLVMGLHQSIFFTKDIS